MGFPITNHPFWGSPIYLKKNHILPRGTEVACSMLSIFCRNFNLCCWMGKVKTTILVDEIMKSPFFLLAHFFLCGFLSQVSFSVLLARWKQTSCNFAVFVGQDRPVIFGGWKHSFFLPNLVLRMATLGVIPKPFCWFMSHYISIRSLVLHPDCPSIN